MAGRLLADETPPYRAPANARRWTEGYLQGAHETRVERLAGLQAALEQTFAGFLAKGVTIKAVSIADDSFELRKGKDVIFLGATDASACNATSAPQTIVQRTPRK